MIYLVIGDQNIRINSQVKKIVKDTLGDEADDINYVKYDGSNTLMQEWLDEVNYLPLGYEKKVVVVSDCYFLLKTKPKNKIDADQDYDELNRYLNNENDFTTLILTINASEKDLDMKSKLMVALKSNGKLLSVASPSVDNWREYVIRQYKEITSNQIDSDALEELINRTAVDIDLLINSIDKLVLYTDHIKYEDVVLMVPRQLEENAFLIFNHLLAGRNKDAIGVWRDLKVVSTEPITLIGMLAKQFRLLNQVNYLVKCGASDYEIANELAIKPGRSAILRKNLYYTSSAAIERTLEDLFNLDLQIKSGQVDRYYVFELFLINFKRK